MVLSPFQPAAEVEDALILDLASPHETLADLAVRHSTSLEALVAWMARPTISARLHAIESACVARARLVATNHLPFVAAAAADLVERERAAALAEADPPPCASPREPASPAHAARARDSTRRALTLLVTLARLLPSASRASPIGEPSPVKESAAAAGGASPPRCANSHAPGPTPEPASREARGPDASQARPEVASTRASVPATPPTPHAPPRARPPPRPPHAS